MKALLEFDDVGAADDESVKGITVGDIRAWHDRIEALEAALQEILWHDPQSPAAAAARAVLDKDAEKRANL